MKENTNNMTIQSPPTISCPTISGYDVVTLQDNSVILALAERAARRHDPIILANSGTPVAALISVEDLNALYEELRCIRILYSVATGTKCPPLS